MRKLNNKNNKLTAISSNKLIVFKQILLIVFFAHVFSFNPIFAKSTQVSQEPHVGEGGEPLRPGDLQDAVSIPGPGAVLDDPGSEQLDHHFPGGAISRSGGTHDCPGRALTRHYEYQDTTHRAASL